MAGVRATLRQLHDLGVRLLIFEGGEPLLWRDGVLGLDDVIVEAKRLFYRVGVTTNGTFPLESEADTIWVSIDGLKETHDTNRGPSFSKIMEHLASTSHRSVYANITIHRDNWEEIPRLVRFLCDRVRGITIQFYYPFPGTYDLALTMDRRVEVLDHLIALKREGLPLVNSFKALEALKHNSWRCHSWLIASAEPDGTVTQGCYLKNRAQVACQDCGFAAHTEISLAYDGSLDALVTGWRIFDSD